MPKDLEQRRDKLWSFCTASSSCFDVDGLDNYIQSLLISARIEELSAKFIDDMSYRYIQTKRDERIKELQKEKEML